MTPAPADTATSGVRKEWMETERGKQSLHSLVAKASDYMLPNWGYISCVFCLIESHQQRRKQQKIRN